MVSLWGNSTTNTFLLKFKHMHISNVHLPFKNNSLPIYEWKAPGREGSELSVGAGSLPGGTYTHTLRLKLTLNIDE